MPKLPKVICHMMATIDGRILTEHWRLSAKGEEQYEAVHALHRADAWMCGRETFQKDFLDQKKDAIFSRATRVPDGDFVSAEATAPSSTRPGKSKRVFAVAVDARGKLKWPSADMRGDVLVVLTTKSSPRGYLADLRAKNISYLLCGAREVDFPSALKRLHKYFGITKVLAEGGGRLNGALLDAQVLDEVSLLICPFADGYAKVPTLFDRPSGEAPPKAKATRLR